MTLPWAMTMRSILSTANSTRMITTIVEMMNSALRAARTGLTAANAVDGE